jgi:imidazolonepropionase
MSFTRAESERIAAAAKELGFSIRVHADQTGDADGTRFAVAVGATTAEHLDRVSDAGLEALAGSSTIGVLFPGATYHMTDMTPKQSGGDAPMNFPEWASRLIDSGSALALSTDFNPGTSPTTSMPATMRLGMRLYRLSYAQVWNMVTLNAAAALGMDGDRGTIQPGSVADLVIWNVSSHRAALHRFGSNLVNSTIVAGERQYANSMARVVFSDSDSKVLDW